MIQFAATTGKGGHLVALGLEEANLAALEAGRPALSAGGPLGAPGNDWAFVHGRDRAALGEAMKAVALRAARDTGQPEPESLSAFCRTGYVHMPVALGELVLHVIGLLPEDLASLRQNKAVSYRYRVLGEDEAARLEGLAPAGAVPAAEVAARLQGGQDAEAGSVLVLIFGCRSAAEAAGQLRQAGLLRGAAPVDRPSNRPAWAAGW